MSQRETESIYIIKTVRKSGEAGRERMEEGF